MALSCLPLVGGLCTVLSTAQLVLPVRTESTHQRAVSTPLGQIPRVLLAYLVAGRAIESSQALRLTSARAALLIGRGAV